MPKQKQRAKFKPDFIKKLRTLWAVELSFLKPARSGVLPHRSSSGAFTIAPDRTRCGKFIHLNLLFSPRPHQAGEFTVEIIVTESEETSERTVHHSGSLEDRTKIENGNYRIGRFMDERFHGDFLVDT